MKKNPSTSSGHRRSNRFSRSGHRESDHFTRKGQDPSTHHSGQGPSTGSRQGWRSKQDREQGRHGASEGTPTSRERPKLGPIAYSGPLIIGRNALWEVVRHAPERIEKVLVAEKAHKAGHVFEELLQALTALGVRMQTVMEEELSEIAGSESHQSFAAFLKPRRPGDFRELLRDRQTRESDLVVLLDSVTDPQNLGSIMRACECFGVSALIWSKNRGAPVTPVVTKTSVGASELLPWYEVSNLVDALLKLKEAGYWVVAAEATEGAVDIGGFEFPQKTALVLGSEGEGIHQLVLKKADMQVKIPLQGKINSLNVSQACAVVLFAYMQQRKRG